MAIGLEHGTGSTEIIMFGVGSSSCRRRSTYYSYVYLRRGGIFESAPARTDLAGFLLRLHTGKSPLLDCQL